MNMTSVNEQYRGLEFKTSAETIEEAKILLEEEASGLQHGLYCRFKELNIGMLRYWRFRQVNMIAGRSGSGKSLFLNMIRNDFMSNKVLTLPTNANIYLGEPVAGTDGSSVYYPEARLWKLSNGELIRKPLNQDCIHNIVMLHFGFEMASADEHIRTAGTIIGKSYAYLMSAQYDVHTSKYNRLTKEERDEIAMIMDTMGDRLEYYVSISGNLQQMWATANHIQELHPNHKLVVNIDHSLLTRRGDEKSTEEFINNIGFFSIRLKQKFGAMVNWLHQLNNEIEKTERIRNPLLHYPVKPDIHYGSQLWWACDNVAVIHVPRLLHITEYGKHELDTTNLLHIALLKSRFGQPGNVWLREDFARGRIHDASRTDFMPTKVVQRY